MGFASPSLDKRNIGFIQNGRLTPTLSISTSLLHFVSMRSSPHTQLKSRCLMRDRSDSSSTNCHTRKPLPVRLSRFDSLNPLVDDSTVATVLRMLSKFVGEDKFLKGVSLYLKKHMYSNTVSRDLWEGIGEATGILSNNLLGVLMTKRGFYRTRHSKDDGELGLEGR